MDYGFSNSEVLFVYMELKKRLQELEKLKDLGQASLVKQDIALHLSVLKKIEAKHPGFQKLPE